jgi:preprotein translocase subunit SecA
LPFADDEAIISSQISWLIEQAQKKIEGQNFDARKNVTDYDDVINRQRQVIYSRRNAVLKNDKFDYSLEIQKTIYQEVQRIVAPLSKKSDAKATEILENVVKALNELVKDEMLTAVDLTLAFKDAKHNHKKLAQNLTDKINARLVEKLSTQTPEVQSAMVRFVYLRAFDILWTEHLITIEHLQDSVRFRSIAQKEPLTEFKEDGMKMFKGLLGEIDSEVARTIFRMEADFVPAGMLESMTK